MDRDTFNNYGWLIITVIISVVLIMFATQYNKDIDSKTKSDINRIVSMTTEQEEIIYE